MPPPGRARGGSSIRLKMGARSKRFRNSRSVNWRNELSAHKKARKRRVPGGHRTPVASGGDWLVSRAKRFRQARTRGRALRLLFAGSILVSGWLRTDVSSRMAGGTIRLLTKRVNTESLLFRFFCRRRRFGPPSRKVSAITADWRPNRGRVRAVNEAANRRGRAKIIPRRARTPAGAAERKT